jgi:hypothetical protein
MDEKKIKEALRLWPGARRGANGVIIDNEFGMFYVTDFGPTDPDLTLEEETYSRICAKHEIIRLREIKSSHDYLLRIRAEAIMNSTRLARAFEYRRKKFETKGRPWSLTNYYASLNDAPKRYISKLPKEDRRRILKIPYGFAPIAQANAACIGSIVGELVITSETLRHFYYFMTICLFGQDWNFPLVDCVDAGLIALRIMNGAESQDFDMDPREALPTHLRNTINRRVNAMIEFTFGHEFAHLLLGHLSDSQSCLTTTGDQLRTYAHQYEYEADLYAIRGVIGKSPREEIAVSACNVFFCLYMLHLIHKDIADYPDFSVSQTHPSPIERITALQRARGLTGQPSEAVLSDSIKAVEVMQKLIIGRVQSSERAHDLLSFYGSIHLGGLGGKPGLDRIDY